jgi:uncharacterized repeat protein (TIGR03803 family)
MRAKELVLSMVGVFAIAAFSLSATSTRAFAQEIKVLQSFNSNGTEGVVPYGGLVLDAAGNLYGTTTYGGGLGCFPSGCGLVFRLSPQAGGGWHETIIHNFNDRSDDGQLPLASLIFDASGNLYGTTSLGGPDGAGTVFKLIPQSDGSWTEQILYAFKRSTDAAVISGSLIFDAAGNLYGTAEEGGLHDSGAVYELSPAAGGRWTEKLLHSFGSTPTDGNTPFGNLVFDASGNLFGTTEGGFGSNFDDGGSVYELLPQPGGGWKEKLLAAFPLNGTGPINPFNGLTFDSAGNLYGTSNAGGSTNSGTVFELSPESGGSWTLKILHTFGQTPADGANPYAGVIFDASGNLYGTTYSGIVFELTPQSEGTWAETIYNFAGERAFFNAGVTLDASGDIYGTASGGGTFFSGMVVEVIP